MNKIILISCVLSIALSLNAPKNGFIGCQGDATNFCGGGTCKAETGVCSCVSPKSGFNCGQAAALITPTANLTTCSAAAIAAGNQFANDCNTALTATLVGLNWKLADNTFTKFSNFLVTFTLPRSAVFTFSTVQMQNALDYAEYQWIYSVYNVSNTTATTFDSSTNKGIAVDYIKAIQAMVNAYNIGNAKQPTTAQNSVTDNTTPAKFQAFATTVGTWVSQMSAIDTTTGDNLGVKSVTTGALVNTFDSGYGAAWTTTVGYVGYQQFFKSWGNPAVVLNKGCLYSALLIVQKLTIGTTAAANNNLALAPADLATGKNQVLVFTDDKKIDEKYMVATIPIALSGDGEVKDAVKCVATKCTISLIVSSGAQLVYVYSTVLSNYLISFSLILSALTLSL